MKITTKGTVEWYNRYKNFGFITIDNKDGRIFFHKKDIVDVGILFRGDTVGFVCESAKKGPVAKRVELLSRVSK